MEMFWRTKSGVYMPLSRMEMNHLKSCYRMMDRNSRVSFDDFGEIINYWWSMAHEPNNLPDIPSEKTLRPSAYIKIWIHALEKEMMKRCDTDYELEYGD